MARMSFDCCRDWMRFAIIAARVLTPRLAAAALAARMRSRNVARLRGSCEAEVGKDPDRDAEPDAESCDADADVEADPRRDPRRRGCVLLALSDDR